MPVATAAAAPPLDPPGEKAVFHGLCVGPKRCGSVTGCKPYSEEFVLPRTTMPARRQRVTISLSAPATLAA